MRSLLTAALNKGSSTDAFGQFRIFPARAGLKVGGRALNNFLCSLLLCFYVFLLSSQAWYTLASAFLVFCPIFAILMAQSFNPLVKLIKHPFFLIHATLCVYSLVAPYLADTSDYSFFRRYAYALLMWINGGCFVYFLGKLFKRSRREIFDAALNAVVISSGLFLLSIVSSDIRLFFLRFISISEYEINLFKSQPYRFGGITGFTGFGISVTFAIAFVLSFFDLRLSYENEKKRCYPIVFRAILALGSVAAGRIGAVIIGFTIILFLLGKMKNLKVVFCIAWVSVSSVLLFLIAFDSNVLFYFKQSAFLSWIFEPIINLIDNGKVSTASTDELIRMYFTPPISTMLMGDLRYSVPETQAYYLGTDVGYMRLILFAGIPLALSFYASWFFLLVKTLKAYKCSSNLLKIFFLFIFTLIELKGDFLFATAPGIRLLFIVYLATFTGFWYCRSAALCQQGSLLDSVTIKK